MRISTLDRMALGLCLLASPIAFAQTFGSITGETRDVSGAVVAGVSVTAINEGTDATRTAVTNEAGIYSFPSLAPGNYTLRAEKSGFRSVVRQHIELQVQQAARIDIDLQIGDVSESVQVRADAALLVGPLP